jgi:hypothetical protein
MSEVVIQRGDGLHLIIQRGLPGAPGKDGVSADWGTLPNKPAVIAAGDTAQEARDAIGLGTLVMADITDKQGKVLDDPVIVSDGDIDSLMTPGMYLLDTNPLNGFFVGCLVLVSEVDGYVFQQFLSPFSGFILRYFDGASWAPMVESVTDFTVQEWYDSTTAEAANAVINADGSFSRSTSSEEYKTGIEPMLDEYADAIVQGAQPIYYRSTCEGDPDDWSYWGISAEQLATVDTRLVHWGHSTKEVPQQLGLPPKRVPDLDSPIKPVGVQYSRIVPALLQVVKRQGAAIEALEARLSALEKRLK